MSQKTFKTSITDMLSLKYPIMLAGMNAVAGADLAAAVSNNGGLGVIGGVGYTPKILQQVVDELKAKLNPGAPFGIDLLLPQVGGNARKTNKDYTEGKLPELIDIVIASKANLFVSAVGVPPKWVCEKLHAAGIPVMNMIGSTRHVSKACEAGVDILCAQGSEGGGHTGEVGTSVLIPQVVALAKKYTSPLTKQPVKVVAAGGIYDGHGLAMALALGAEAVWVGTRFICAKEASAGKRHQDAVLKATSEDTIRTTMYTGRPMRIYKTKYAADMEELHRDKLRQAQVTGEVAVKTDLESRFAAGEWGDKGPPIELRHPLLMGQAAGAVAQIQTAKEIMDGMVKDAVAIVEASQRMIAKL